MPILKNKKYNFIGKYKPFDSKYLAVSFDGSSAVLSKNEYFKLATNNLDEELYSKLESGGVIVTENNQDDIVFNYGSRKDLVFQGTSLHIVIPTLRCNQKCVYCHAASKDINSKGYDMDKETAKKTVDFLLQSPSPAITIEFQGGEPLLNFPIVRLIIDYAKEINREVKKDLKIALVSNLTLMNDEILDYLIEQNVGMCTSLDGPKLVHDNNRRLTGGGSYDEVTKWIRIINDAQKERNKMMGTKNVLHALTTITRFSLPYHKEIIDEYERFGLPDICIREVSPYGFAGSSWDKISYSADEYLDFWRKCVDYVYSEKKFSENSSLILLKKILLKKDPHYLDIMSPCGAAIGQIAYMHDGSIYSCDEGRMYGGDFFRLGSVHTDTYKSVLGSPKVCGLIASSVNDNYLCSECIYQPYCGICPVWNKMSSNNMIPKLAMDRRCKTLKAQFEHIFRKLLFDQGFQDRIKNIKEFKDSSFFSED